jgi:hypothetical protein
MTRRLHRPTSVWTLLEAVNSVIGLTALYHIVRALRWDAVRGRGLTDLGRYRRSPRGPKGWRPYTSWGRCTSRGGVHARRTKRQLANCFRWLCLRTSFLTPRRPHRRPPTRRGGRGRPWTGDRRTHSWATTEDPRSVSPRQIAPGATPGVWLGIAIARNLEKRRSASYLPSHRQLGWPAPPARPKMLDPRTVVARSWTALPIPNPQIYTPPAMRCT